MSRFETKKNRVELYYMDGGHSAYDPVTDVKMDHQVIHFTMLKDDMIHDVHAGETVISSLPFRVTNSHHE